MVTHSCVGARLRNKASEARGGTEEHGALGRAACWVEVMIDAELVLPVHVGHKYREDVGLAVRELSDIQRDALLGEDFRLGRGGRGGALARGALSLRPVDTEEAAKRERGALWPKRHVQGAFHAPRLEIIYAAGVGGDEAAVVLLRIKERRNVEGRPVR